MTQFIEKTGRNEAEAIRLALEELKLERDDVSIEVIDRAKSGFMGFGSKPAKVRVTYEDGTSEEIPKKEDMSPIKVTDKQEKVAEKVADVVSEQKSQAEVKDSKVDSKQETANAFTEKENIVKTPVKEEKEKNLPVKAEVMAENKEEISKVNSKVDNQDKNAEKAVVKPVSKLERVKKEGRGKDKISLEDQEVITAEITRFLTGLMEHLHVDAKPTVSYNKDIVLVKMEGENLASLIGKRGETLDAIQQITGYVVNKTCQKRVRIYLDAENYRAKREETLIKLAEKVAGEAVKHKRNVPLEPMNAYERHIIHEALTKNPLVYTYSTGSDPNRCTVIAYQTKKPQGNRQKRS